MDAPTARRAVDAAFRAAQAHGYTSIHLKYAGGEPTLNFGALRAAQSRAQTLSAQTGIDLGVRIITNGIHITDAQMEGFLADDISVTLSLDGLARHNDVQRPLAGQNGSAFDRVDRTLDRLLRRGVLPDICVTITKWNLDGLPTLIGYLLDQGLCFRLNFYRQPDPTTAGEMLDASQAQMIHGLRRAFRVIESRLPQFSLLSNLADRADLRVPHLTACGAGRNYMAIDCDGSVCRCQMELAHPVSTIWAEDPLAAMHADKEGLQNPPVDERDCRACVWRYRCGGGCPRLTFQRTGRFDARSPLCEVYQAILPEVVRLEALRLLKFEEPFDLSVPLGQTEGRHSARV